MKTNIQPLHFRPLTGLSSKHLQTIVPVYLSPGEEPPSTKWIVELGEGDCLSCELSIPPHWDPTHSTVAMVHGLGGSHLSGYMIRLARKFYLKGYKVIRVNLRGCGSGQGLSKLPYHAGTSEDLFKVLESCKREEPHSPLILMGFSLGGNVVLKLTGELGEKAQNWIHRSIAICPPLDLGETSQILTQIKHRFYQSYYIKMISEQARSWLRKKVYTLNEFDNHVTAPLWGFKGAHGYYENCSCVHYLSSIRHDTHILFAEDDPFINYKRIYDVHLPESVNVWTTRYGGHMGFLGQRTKDHHFYWMDQLLLNWLGNDFASNLKKE